MTIRGFAGLPDGSEWIVDEVALAGHEGGRDEGARAGRDVGRDEGGRDEGVPSSDGAAFETAGRELARRMTAAGAGELLRAAEAMAAG